MNNIFDIIEKESQRQNKTIELIASENFVSENVLKAQGSILTNKYAEGYPGKRYYGGCEFVDQIEVIAQENLKKLFGAEYVNVQPHSGSQANMGVYLSVLEPGDTLMGMNLNDGGHLTHGLSINFSGRNYNIVSYGLNENEEIDYESVRKIALENKPKLIVCGASAYSRIIDFAKFKEIADEVGAYLMADIAHIAGLVVAGLHPSPFPHADFVTSTTHKTLRGPRGGVIMAKAKYEASLNRSIFPGIQGGPLMHVIAGKAIAFEEALQPEFIEYQKNVVVNAKAMSERFKEIGYKVVSGGTDNHLFMVDVYNSEAKITGKEAQDLLDSVNMTLNKNTVPNEELSPMVTSGIRIGTAAMTTKGMTAEQFRHVADLIDMAMKNRNDEEKLEKVRQYVQMLIEHLEK